LVKITLLEDNANILTSKYQLYLPSEKALLEEIRDVIDYEDETHKPILRAHNIQECGLNNNILTFT